MEYMAKQLMAQSQGGPKPCRVKLLRFLTSSRRRMQQNPRMNRNEANAMQTSLKTHTLQESKKILETCMKGEHK